MKDWRGNEFEVGDTVLYPRMSGRSCEMVEGTVIEFAQTKPSYGEPQPVVVIEAKRSSRFRFGTDTERPEWYGRWGRGERVRITIINNITKVAA